MRQEIVSWILPATVGMSLLSALAIWLNDTKSARFHNWTVICGAVIKLCLVLSLLPGIWAGQVFCYKLFVFMPHLEVAFRVDGLGFLFAFIASFLWVITAVYSIEYMKQEHSLPRYWTFLSLCMGSTLGIAYAANLFTLFLFYEILTICTYPLIIHSQSPEAMRAGRKYLLYSIAGGAALMLSLALTYYLSGNLELGQKGILPPDTNPVTLYFLFCTFIFGFGVKSVLMPMHSWLPDSMIAPTPVSAILHAVAVVKSGVYGILRTLIDIFGLSLIKDLKLNNLLLVIVCVTIITASVMAIYQDSLKKMLAYSTVSQLSYIALGVALISPSGVTGGVLHMFYQSIMKITLFFCAGAIFRQTGITQISQMQGIGQRIPLVMGAFSIAALGMIGIPFTAGFISKWYLAVGAVEADQLLVVGVIVISALLNAVYYLPVLYKAFFQHPQTGEEIEAVKPAWGLVAPCLITASLVLAFGISPWLHRLPLFLAESISRGFLSF